MATDLTPGKQHADVAIERKPLRTQNMKGVSVAELAINGSTMGIDEKYNGSRPNSRMEVEWEIVKSSLGSRMVVGTNLMA